MCRRPSGRCGSWSDGPAREAQESGSSIFLDTLGHGMTVSALHGYVDTEQGWFRMARDAGAIHRSGLPGKRLNNQVV
jgi:hypothetical protein